MKIVDTQQMKWESGWQTIASMPDSYKANLGPAELLEGAYSKYWQKTLSIDSVSSFRADLVDLQPGFADLTDAYHDSVEEAFFISGDCTLSGEQSFYGGHYFWRPPGFIHAATSISGFRAILMQEGEDPSEGSGRSSRIIRPAEEAGSNALNHDQVMALGPRGWVKVDSQSLPWEPLLTWSLRQRVFSSHSAGEVKVLSRNSVTDSQSILLRLPAHFAGKSATPGASIRAFILEGSINIDSQSLSAETWFEISPDESAGSWVADSDTLIFAKFKA